MGKGLSKERAQKRKTVRSNRQTSRKYTKGDSRWNLEQGKTVAGYWVKKTNKQQLTVSWALYINNSSNFYNLLKCYSHLMDEKIKI